ncbi:DUF4139 domain-containing protein [Cryomorphaceae bacterium]|nr:DUF4139 domain-containing protein [Cryomorphaceae bacterium]
MKHLLTAALAVLLSFSVSAEGEIISEVDEVTFFLSGAQIKRSADIQFSAGIQEVILHGLEPSINPSSIILAGTGPYTLLSYRHEIRTIQPDNAEPTDPRARELQAKIKAADDSLSDMRYWQQDMRFRLDVLKNEKRLLLENPINQGQAIGDSLELLKNAVDYLSKRLTIVNDALLELQREEALYTQTGGRLGQRLQALRQEYQSLYPTKNPYYDYRLVLTIDAERAGSGSMDFSYTVPSAGWQPEIEFRSNGYGEPMELQQRALLHQNTGTDWKGIDLFVSTSNPAGYRNKPMLQPWVLNFIQRGARRDAALLDAVQVYAAEEDVADEEVMDAVIVQSFDVAQAKSYQQLAYKRFEFDRKFTVKSGAAYPVRVKLESAKLDCEYRLVAVPKLDSRVYVQARFADWQEYMLPDAKAKLYYQNMFLGELAIHQNMYADTLEVSMGFDDGIQVTRELLMSGSKNRIIGKRIEQERVYSYRVQNFKSSPVTVYIEDHIPLSRQEGLEIERMECRKGSYTEHDGKLEWKFDLDGKATETYECGFRVSYPKDKVVQGL